MMNRQELIPRRLDARSGWLALVTIVLAATASACNIPVFRYALERWRSDAYQLVVSHRGELSTEQIKRVQELKLQEKKANVQVIVQTDEQAAEPLLTLRLALPTGRMISHWQARLADASSAQLFVSPARDELMKRLLSGHSVVWLLIHSGSTDKLEQTRSMLETAFDALSQSVQIPDGIGEPGSELHSEVPLFIKFSVIEIDAKDEREAYLVQWLSGFRPEALANGEPLLVPVFGRGRVLEVIPASTLNPALIEDLTHFLSGACSCQVKEQNPGFDLLLTQDWDRALFGEDGLRPPPPATSTGASAGSLGGQVSGSVTTPSGSGPRKLAIPPGKAR